MLAAIRRGLSETGYVEGKNVAIEYSWGRGQYGRMQVLAEELVFLWLQIPDLIDGVSVVLRTATRCPPVAAGKRLHHNGELQ